MSAGGSSFVDSGARRSMTSDDKEPMQKPRSTRDVMKAAPPKPRDKSDAPKAPATDAATHGVKSDQEAG